MKDNLIRVFNFAGFNWLVPLIRLASGEDPGEQLRSLWKSAGIPAVTFAVFLAAWSIGASHIQTSLGKVPGPKAVFEQAQVLAKEHRDERKKRANFYTQQRESNEKNPQAAAQTRKYAGNPTYVDQILTSLATVFTGFLIASLVAIPLGVLCGLSRTLMMALNPLIQIFKPVSPVAWLPIVTMIVSAVYKVPHPWLQKCFIISAVTVSLCSLWPSLINTALGVSSIDKDYLNVARVLQLNLQTKIFKIVLPAAMPYIFTGLRISLGVGWMVLIASELLSQNPGLGKFVWDEFQNGSSQSLARIMVAVFTIGIIGFFLERVMVTLQKSVSFSPESVSV